MAEFAAVAANNASNGDAPQATRALKADVGRLTMTKHAILEQIKKLAAENGGKPPGERAFMNETGIAKSSWWPTLWIKWGDALEEAGFPRNTFTGAIDQTVLFEKYLALVRELGHLPVHGELRRKQKTDPSFPTDNVFLFRFGGKDKLVAALMAYCKSKPGYEDVILLCKSYLERSEEPTSSQRSESKSVVSYGYVYLMKSGRHYKIGYTNSVGRREWELGIKIPIPPKTVHFIKTDDPAGVEAYWHKRLSERRGEGEWFDLSADDITAFKRWKRIS